MYNYLVKLGEYIMFKEPRTKEDFDNEKMAHVAKSAKYGALATGATLGASPIASKLIKGKKITPGTLTASAVLGGTGAVLGAGMGASSGYLGNKLINTGRFLKKKLTKKQ